MKAFLSAAALILTLGCANSVMAETNDTGFYVGGDIGRTQLKFGSLLDDSAASVGVYGGYNINEWFALESHAFVTGDYDLGYKGSQIVLFNQSATINKSELSAVAVAITPKVTWKINDIFSAYAKAGVSYMQVSSEFYFSGSDLYGSTVMEHDGWGYVFGTGVNATITPHLVIRLNYEFMSGDLESDDYLAKASDLEEIDTDFSQFSLGLHYQF
ncbi:outer membrane beta-barrel protein [Shewanella surugensis]|uniref:Outer membrane beta-barrel protein n=1 Tax=Shewanella surugensis TaxID=212020 RepID=A0ABT0LDZ9_9GAMM|nr:outer membrane beta-barrel protein [Shewanella surugensis]MCL1125926.1 outer membrane beta-barrel protein [Shewanella surugensis]